MCHICHIHGMCRMSCVTCHTRALRYEKATALITHAIAQGRGDDIGMVVVDEMQMIGEGGGDSCRGALLETMVLKLLHFCPQVRSFTTRPPPSPCHTHAPRHTSSPSPASCTTPYPSPKPFVRSPSSLIFVRCPSRSSRAAAPCCKTQPARFPAKFQVMKLSVSLSCALKSCRQVPCSSVPPGCRL